MNCATPNSKQITRGVYFLVVFFLSSKKKYEKKKALIVYIEQIFFLKNVSSKSRSSVYIALFGRQKKKLSETYILLRTIARKVSVWIMFVFLSGSIWLVYFFVVLLSFYIDYFHLYSSKIPKKKRFFFGRLDLPNKTVLFSYKNPIFEIMYPSGCVVRVL